MKKVMTCVFFLSVSLLASQDLTGSDAAGILAVMAAISVFPTLSLIMSSIQKLVVPGLQAPRTFQAQAKKEFAHH